jgi:hypothetical protein
MEPALDMAEGRGFEPQYTGPEPVVLPLDDPSVHKKKPRRTPDSPGLDDLFQKAIFRNIHSQANDGFAAAASAAGIECLWISIAWHFYIPNINFVNKNFEFSEEGNGILSFPVKSRSSLPRTNFCPIVQTDFSR